MDYFDPAYFGPYFSVPHYFSCDYFGSYFDTPDCGTPVTGSHRVGRVVIPPPVELDEADEFLAVI